MRRYRLIGVAGAMSGGVVTKNVPTSKTATPARETA